MNICKGCGTKTTNPSYCSNSCQQKCNSDKAVEKWLNNQSDTKSLKQSHRKYLIKEADNKCSCCGWSEVNIHTGKIPLEIDHIDGDPSNNKLSNLRVLCPNCHSLTKTYKGANKRSSRTYRNTKIVEVNQKRLNKERELKFKKDKILEANIDFGVIGWVQNVSTILDMSPQKVRGWMKKHLPEIEKVSYRRK